MPSTFVSSQLDTVSTLIPTGLVLSDAMAERYRFVGSADEGALGGLLPCRGAW